LRLERKLMKKLAKDLKGSQHTIPIFILIVFSIFVMIFAEERTGVMYDTLFSFAVATIVTTFFLVGIALYNSWRNDQRLLKDAHEEIQKIEGMPRS
jgi:amino acid transporter